MDEKTAGIRKEYTQKALVESGIEADPVTQFNLWWLEALEAKIIEVNAMTLATASADGIPSARTVLMKGFQKKDLLFLQTMIVSRASSCQKTLKHVCFFSGRN